MALLSGPGLAWFLAVDLTVLVASSACSVLLFRRLQLQRRLARIERGGRK